MKNRCAICFQIKYLDSQANLGENDSYPEARHRTSILHGDYIIEKFISTI